MQYEGENYRRHKTKQNTGSTHTQVGMRLKQAQARLGFWVTAHQQDLKFFNEPSAAVCSSFSHNYTLSRETSLANRCFLFSFLKGEVKLPAVNKAQSTLSTFWTLILLKTPMLTPCWYSRIIMLMFQLLNQNSTYFYLFIDLQIHCLCNEPVNCYDRVQHIEG